MLTAINREIPPAMPVDPNAAPQAPKELPLDLLGSDTLPTGRKVGVVAMKGKVERAFFQAIQKKDPLEVLKGWDQMILAVTAMLDDKPPKLDDIVDMDEADRRAIMLMCRRRTYSDPLVEFNWKCAAPLVPKARACGGENEQVIDLGDLTYEKVEPPQPVPLRCGKTLTYGRPTGRTAEIYLKLRRKQETADYTQMMIARQVKLDGERATEREIDELSLEDYGIIKREMVRAYGPKSLVETECRHCQYQLRTNLETIPGFFFQTAEM